MSKRGKRDKRKHIMENIQPQSYKEGDVVLLRNIKTVGGKLGLVRTQKVRKSFLKVYANCKIKMAVNSKQWRIQGMLE